MKKCSIPLPLIKEMKIKTIMSYYLTLIRIAMIKKKKKTSAGKNMEKREPYTLLIGI